MNSNIKKQLKKMRVNPLSRQEKDAVWKQVRLGMTKTIQNTTSKSYSFSSIFKKSMAVTLIFGMTMGTASAANEARPGDVLFPLDRAMENAHLFIASNGKKDELKVKFALERVEEVKEIFSEISTKTKIKEAEEGLKTPPEKVEEDPPAGLPEQTGGEEDITPLEPLSEIIEIAQTADGETGEEEKTQEDSETTSSDNDLTGTTDTGEQVGSSNDDIPVGVEADTASSSEQENLENEKTGDSEVTDGISSQNGSTTEDASTDKKEAPETNESGVEMSDMDKKRIELALGTALDFLSDVKGELAEQGNNEAASFIDNLLKDLNDEIETLPENITFEVKLSPSKQKVQFEITSEDDKDVVYIVETPKVETDNESDTIKQQGEETDKPKETKLEIKDGALTIKTENDEETSPATEVMVEETGEDEDVNPPTDGEDTETNLPDNESVDPTSAEESSGVAKQKQSTTTEDVLDDDLPVQTDGEDDGTTTVKVIIKKLDEDIEFSVTDQNADLHEIIKEYTDEKGDV